MRAVRPLGFFLLLSSAALGCGDDGSGTGGSSGTGTGPGTGTGTDTGTGTTTTSSASTGTGCEGGVIEDGVCVGKCTPETCSFGNTCVANRCVLQCVGHEDCFPGTECTDAVQDDTGAAIKVCTPGPKAAILGSACYFGNECDAVTVCPDGTLCGASLCGGQACTDGACPDGTPCTAQSCDAAACRSPRCLGAVDEESPSGSAYCTQNDCTADADCAPGMWCGKTRDFHEICGADPQPELASESPCIDPDEFTTDGKTFEEGPVSLLRNTCLLRKQCHPCTEDLDCSGVPGQLCAQIGGEQRCAQLCATDDDCERDAECLEDPAHPGSLVCTPRYGSCAGEGEFCAPCVNDLDCGDTSTSMICGNTAGAQRFCYDITLPDLCEATCPDGTACDQFMCGGGDRVCNEEGLCEKTDSCDPEVCGTGDPADCVDNECPDGSSCFGDVCPDDLACIPNDGAGAAGYCEPSIPCTPQNCTTTQCTAKDDQCPLSVDGARHGECLDKEEGYNANDYEYGRCFLPWFSGSYRYQCW